MFLSGGVELRWFFKAAESDVNDTFQLMLIPIRFLICMKNASSCQGLHNFLFNHPHARINLSLISRIIACNHESFELIMFHHPLFPMLYNEMRRRQEKTTSTNNIKGSFTFFHFNEKGNTIKRSGKGSERGDGRTGLE